MAPHDPPGHADPQHQRDADQLRCADHDPVLAEQLETEFQRDESGNEIPDELRRNGELFVRWMEMNAFTPLMRSHESLRPDKNAQFDAPDVREYTAALTRLHAALKPYFQRVLSRADEGIPALRPDFYGGDFSGASDDSSEHVERLLSDGGCWEKMKVKTRRGLEPARGYADRGPRVRCCEIPGPAPGSRR